MRIVVLGGGFGGVTAVRHLERVLPRVDIQVSTAVRSIDKGHVHLDSDTIDAGTIGTEQRTADAVDPAGRVVA